MFIQIYEAILLILTYDFMYQHSETYAGEKGQDWKDKNKPY